MADRLAQLSSSAASLMGAPASRWDGRVSDNIEDVRDRGPLDYLLAEARSLPPYLSMYAQDVANRLGDKPSDELMAQRISEIGNLLPQQEIPRFGPYEMPRFADGGSVDETLAQYDPMPWRSSMDVEGGIPTGGPRDAGRLSPGPEPTGYDKVFDTAYGLLGGKPENRRMAEALAGIFNVGTLGMATGAYEGAKDLARTGSPTTLAMALMPGAKVAGPVAKVAEKAAEKGIRAFHGSPHDFDRFDLSKIGTGEGAQAYGHGLYFAENEGVAKSYRDMLSPVKADGKQLSDALSIELGSFGGNVDDLMNLRKQQLERWVQSGVEDKKGIIPALRKDIRELEKLKKKDVQSAGHMYEVNIKATPEDFLDWDKPLSQQSEKVKEALASVRESQLSKPLLRSSQPHLIDKLLDEKALAGDRGNMTYDYVRGALRQDGIDIDSLTRDAGIPGIKYLDQGSRGAGEGSRNYVVFDDSLIDIVRKYGIGGLLAMYYGAGSDKADASETRKPEFAEGGAVSDAQYDAPDTYLTDGKRPSVSAPFSDKVDLATAILRNYGRSAMQNYGLPPWGQAIGDLGMEVALSPATSASSLSKVMAAPVDWLSGREVAAEPMDVLYALPTAAGAVGRVLGPAIHMRGAAKAQRDANDFLAARRAKEDLPYDLHIKKLLDDMAARTKWD